jgi:hypothetical protein
MTAQAVAAGCLAGAFSPFRRSTRSPVGGDHVFEPVDDKPNSRSHPGSPRRRCASNRRAAPPPSRRAYPVADHDVIAADDDLADLAAAGQLVALGLGP